MLISAVILCCTDDLPHFRKMLPDILRKPDLAPGALQIMPPVPDSEINVSPEIILQKTYRGFHSQ